YTVTANDGSCNQSVSVQVNVAEDPVGIDELDFQYLDIFPNPTMSEFVISWESTDRIDVLRIYNMQGKIMHEEQLKSNVEQKTISAASWAAGVYFIELTGAKGTVQKKLIKQ
ncbi:MAG: T9SS type A sorting domain-containing protein, partial [Chitinophagales bacterium]